MNKLILIDGGPASGKNTLSEILVEKLNAYGDKSILLDKDRYVEEFCPSWIWENEKQKEIDLSKAKANYINDINKFIQDGFTVIAIGQRFLTKNDVTYYINKLVKKVPVYLYHLSIPITLRKQRLNQRGPHSLIDLDKDQKDRDAVKFWPGHIYQNINSYKFAGN